MFKDFLMKKMLKKQGVSEDQADQMIQMFNKDPELFKKIAEETQAKIKEGKDQMQAASEVMQKYQDELKKLQ